MDVATRADRISMQAYQGSRAAQRCGQKKFTTVEATDQLSAVYGETPTDRQRSLPPLHDPLGSHRSINQDLQMTQPVDTVH